MSLYFKESPEHLIEALDSIFSQTIVSDDIILVEDGKIGEVSKLEDKQLKEYTDAMRNVGAYRVLKGDIRF